MSKTLKLVYLMIYVKKGIQSVKHEKDIVEMKGRFEEEINKNYRNFQKYSDWEEIYSVLS